METKPQILIVDDETDMCWALENILNLTGYRPASTNRGENVFELLKQYYPDVRVVFLDIKLPDVDAQQLARLIRQHFPEIKIVVVSGYYYRDSEIIQKNITNKTFDGFIGKPFNISEIHSAVKTAFSY